MAGLRDRLDALLASARKTATTVVRGGGPRVAGPPRSANGASSFHLIWQMPRVPDSGRLAEVSAVLEVLEPPKVPALYFWALQVDFEEDGLVWGGGHTGLQWNPRFPKHAAINWGGYATQERGGAVLQGTLPTLRTFAGDPNTAGFDWKPDRPYRLRVFRSPEFSGAWRADITDVATGRATVIRDLLHPGRAAAASGRAGAALHAGHLRQPMVWSEVFADCDAPSVIVRWSELTATTEDGIAMIPDTVNVSYQAPAAGGCANTSVRRDDAGLLQVTNTAREIGQGARLEWRRS